MSKPELIEKKALTLVELKASMDSIKKRDEELGFRSNKTLEYVNSLNLMSKTAHANLVKKLEAINIPRIKEEHIVKIVDFLPKSVAELDVLLQGYTLTMTKDNKTKIISAVKEFLPKK